MTKPAYSPKQARVKIMFTEQEALLVQDVFERVYQDTTDEKTRDYLHDLLIDIRDMLSRMAERGEDTILTIMLPGASVRDGLLDICKTARDQAQAAGNLDGFVAFRDFTDELAKVRFLGVAKPALISTSI